MTTAKAIATLREKAGGKTGLTQREFAARLELSVAAISRLENGNREPSRPTLKKLAELAASAGVDYLRDFFEAQRRASIIARVERSKAISAGAERHIPLHDLRHWSDQQQLMSFLLDGLAKALRKANPDLLRMLTDLLSEEADCDSDTLRQALSGMGRRLETIHNDLEVYIRGGNPPKRAMAPDLRSILNEIEAQPTKGENPK